MLKKKLLISLIGIPVFLIVGLWFLFNTLNIESFKPYINHQLSSLFSQTAEIKGPLKWKIFPHPGVTLTNILIGNNKQTKGYALTLDTLNFDLKLSSLLQGDLLFTALNIDGFKLYLNLPVSKHLHEETPPLKKVSSKPKTNRHFLIKRFFLSKGKIYINEPASQTIISNFSLEAENMNLNKKSIPFKLRAAISTQKGQEKLLKTNLQFQGKTYLPANFIQHLEAIKVNGQLTCNNLYIKPMKIDKLNANTYLKSGILTLDPLSFNLYEATSVGNLHYNLMTKILDVRQTATDLNVEQLTADLLKKSTLTGQLDYSISTQINYSQHTKNGQGYINIKEGEINTINLDEIITLASQKISQLFTSPIASELLESKRIPNSPVGGKTSFEVVSIPWSLNNNMLSSENLNFRTQNVQLTGQGTLNLADRHFAGHLQAQIKDGDETLRQLQTLLGGSFPLLMQGYLTEPLILPDMAKINPIITRLLLSKTLSKPVDRLKNELKAILN